MAMMTARKRTVREAPWSRAICGRASGRGLKSAPASKSVCCYERAGERSAFVARISTTIDWTAGDNALCLARQAGPGPRI
jgi:hypothetical protein